MTPVLTSPRCITTPASHSLKLAARIARDAARSLANEATERREAARYLLAAARLTSALDSPRAGRLRLLMASPAVAETSGRTRTLVEMIEMVEGEPDDAYRLRLAKLLLRALTWRPDTFPPSED